ncbi:MAG: DUF2442 domain-containing protein [Geitlerinemataceae cyanobacterium]
MTSLTLILESEPLAVNVACADKMSIVHLADDRLLSVPLNWYPPLLNRTPEKWQNWEFLGDGYAIERSNLDEYIGVERVLADRMESC